jgi:hypothetical protein
MFKGERVVAVFDKGQEQSAVMEGGVCYSGCFTTISNITLCV